MLNTKVLCNSVLYISEDGHVVRRNIYEFSVCISTNFKIFAHICWYYYCIYSNNARIVDRIKVWCVFFVFGIFVYWYRK